VNRQTPASSPTHMPEKGTHSALVVATLALCGTVVSLQQTLVLPLLPDFPRLLDTTVDNASWLVTVTLLTGAVSIPTITRLADMFGKKRMMVVALTVMVAGSMVGALSEAFAMVITARAMQGVGMALVPVGIAIMRDELPRDRVPLGVALMSATLAMGAGVGLPLSGLIAEHMDWHSIFWVTGVVGAVMLLAVTLVVSESQVRTRGVFDYRGALLLTTALTAVLLTLSKGGQWGWTSAPTLLLAVLGVSLLVAWVPLELQVRNPLVDVRVAARPAVLVVNLASVLTGFAMFANMLVTTQLLQLPTSTGYGLGLDILQTGVWMVPSALIFAAMAPVSASLIRRFGPQMTLLAGALVMAGSYVARVFLSHELWQIVAGSVLVGAGTSMTYAAMPTLIMRAVPVTETASANGLNMLLRSIGTSTSSAAMAAVTTLGIVRVGAEVFPSFDALVAVFWVSAVMSLLAALLAVLTFRMREYSEETAEPAGHMRDAVVHGRVVSTTGRPVRNAVVTVLTPSGEQVDWSQVDSAGDFSAAIPGTGRYLLVTAAEGWRPQSHLADLDAGSEIAPIVLPERLTLAGTITDSMGPVERALVALTRQSGEAVGTAYTGDDGRFEMPLPPNGRYVLTVVTPSGATAARAVTVWGAARVIDVELAGGDAVMHPKIVSESVR
jgi:MFS family permease